VDFHLAGSTLGAVRVSSCATRLKVGVTAERCKGLLQQQHAQADSRGLDYGTPGPGLDKLAQQMRGEMQEELGHSDRFIERIMFLKGSPEISFEKPPHRATSLVDMFKSDLADEEDAIAFYTKAARAADDLGDIGSRTLFEQIVLDEEGHKGWLELQLDLLERIGEQAYSAKFVSIGVANAS
jgi:bacterioferritin